MEFMHLRYWKWDPQLFVNASRAFAPDAKKDPLFNLFITNIFTKIEARFTAV